MSGAGSGRDNRDDDGPSGEGGPSRTTCIYCGKVNDRPFPEPEHVIPQAFGTFEQNFTLHRVCVECNNEMGNDLEVFFARDSGEALMRLIIGLKPANEADHIKGKRIEFRIRRPGNIRDGAFVALTFNEEQGVVITLLPQVAFRHPAGDKWVWFRERELTEESVAPYRRLTESMVFGHPNEITRIMARLEELGVVIGQGLYSEHEYSEDEDGKIDVEIRYVVDDLVRRTIAKIAFNYLAYVTKDQPEFCLSPVFDDVRRYVRYGEKPPRPVVDSLNGRVLAGEAGRYRQTRGHIVTADWKPEGNVLGQVVLFNEIPYAVALSYEPPSVIWWDFRSAHVFDIESRTIHPILSVRRLQINSLLGLRTKQ